MRKNIGFIGPFTIQCLEDSRMEKVCTKYVISWRKSKAWQQYFESRALTFLSTFSSCRRWIVWAGISTSSKFTSRVFSKCKVNVSCFYNTQMKHFVKRFETTTKPSHFIWAQIDRTPKKKKPGVVNSNARPCRFLSTYFPLKMARSWTRRDSKFPLLFA